MARIFNSPSKYVQGPDALAELASYIEPFGSKALAISTASGVRRVGAKIEGGFADSAASVTFEEFNGECCDSEIDRICAVAQAAGSDVIVGVGGGKVLDTAKAVPSSYAPPPRRRTRPAAPCPSSTPRTACSTATCSSPPTPTSS